MLFRICVACDHTNPPDSRFCGKCGAPLQVRFCRLCRTANDAVSRYCQSCGTELPELAAPETAPPPAPGPATIPPLVIATPGRPVADAMPAAAAAKTITSAFSGDEARGKTNPEAGVPPMDGLAAQPAGRNGAQPAIEVLPPRPARATPILVDSAVTTVTLPAVIDDAPPGRTWRAPVAALVVGVAVIGVALGALAYKAWRPGAADPAPDRAAAPAVPPPAAPAAPAWPADAAAAAPAQAPPPQPTAQPVAPPAASANKTAARERREAAPRTSGRAAAVAAAPSSPALRECTPAVAALGLCTPESKPEGN